MTRIKRPWRPALATLGLALALALAPEPAPAQNMGDRQFYSGWSPLGPGQYVSKYYYKPNPGDQAYHFQYVVSDRSNPGLLFFRNANNQYWCAAPTDPARSNQWHVFSDRQTATIGQAVAQGLPTLQPRPRVPNAALGDNTPMQFPTNISSLPGR